MGFLIRSLEKISVENPLISISLWNEKYLFTGDKDGFFRLFVLETGIQMKKFSEHCADLSSIKKIELPQLGECLITYEDDINILLWKINKWRILKNLIN